jgi:hypothetical protein
MIYLVTYELHAPTKDYQGLYDDIKKCGLSWISPMNSVWLIETELPTKSVAEKLIKHLDGNDQLFIVECESEWASFNLNEDDIKWFEERSGK